MSNSSDVSLLGKIANYTEILAKDPNSTVFVLLGETYRRMGLLDDALEVIEKGIRAHPGHALGYSALGRIQAQRSAFDEAASAFEKALELDSQNLSALRGLTRLWLRKGDKPSARELLEQIISLNPDDKTARELLDKLGGARRPASSAPVKTALPPEMPAPSQRPAKGEGEPISTPTIAELYIRQGFPRRAMKVYRDLLTADPGNDWIRQKLVALKQHIDGEQISSIDTPASASDRPAERERAEREKAEREKAEREKAEREKAEREKAEREKVVSTFNGWLNSISRRREHVR